MAVKISVLVRNARLDAIEATIGVSAVLMIREGAAPAGIADADSGAVLATLTLPVDWMGDAAIGAKALAGVWSDTVADNTGTAGHFRIYASGGVTQHMQGTITATGGGGDMTLDSIAIVAGQTVTITACNFTEENA